MRDYLSDNVCPEPSFSASCGKTLLQMSPKHAWMVHPRLGNNDDEPPNHKADFGSIVHELVLGCGAQYRVIDVDDWRTKAAREARDETIAAGLTPIKRDDFERAEGAAKAIRAELAEVFEEGEAERTMIWRDGDLWCRARPDWLVRSAHMVFDLKLTGVSVSPLERKLERHIYEMWYDLTVAHYMDGYRALYGEKLEYRLLFVEDKPPFSIRPMQLSGQGLEMGQRKLEAARWWFKRCLKDGRWPGIPLEMGWAEPEPWQATNWLTYDTGPDPAHVEAAVEFNRPLEAPA
jgi:hypothetical protein